MEIAAPVFDYNGNIVGALSISGPAMRLAGSRLVNELVPLIQQEAARLSNDLGHRQDKTVFLEFGKKLPKPIRKGRKLITTSCTADRVKTCC